MLRRQFQNRSIVVHSCGGQHFSKAGSVRQAFLTKAGSVDRRMRAIDLWDDVVDAQGIRHGESKRTIADGNENAVTVTRTAIPVLLESMLTL